MSDTAALFRQLAPAVDFCSLRVVETRDECLSVRQDVPEPAQFSEDRGAMVTVIEDGGLGYAATSDLTPSGLREALNRARGWARGVADRCVIDYRTVAMPHPVGSYRTVEKEPWQSRSTADKFDLLARECRRLKTDDRIVDWECSLWRTAVDSLTVTGDGGQVDQAFRYLSPSMSVTANAGAITQRRSLGSQRGSVRQGGLEMIEAVGFQEAAPVLADEALQLLAAPNCPEGWMDLLLMPDQLFLQIHESVGHPLEMDRILGDERNYAGTSFVKPHMVGDYQYGSSLMNITFDPEPGQEFASYGFDDEGAVAKKQYVIEQGILKRLLGSVVSQTRGNLPGVACGRACNWNRPPIDRMANLNLEPGDASLDAMIGAVERGVLMKANTSWSIDDSRNKFQFGCEWGQMIENGRLTGVVRSPNYRGISATFWRNLAMVGDASQLQYLGSPFCGKGEPNQVIRVGHACPPALFRNVDVFGGAA